ncbi:MAG: M15 family metallopeptidase, partial [Clostridia bacterium]|nr:M15 family metallopeptidase [Clostridia bacterium]
MKNGLKNVLAAALAVLFVFSAAACSKKKSGGQPAEVAVNDHTEAPAATIPYTVDTEPPATPAPTPGPTAAPGETPYGTPKPTPEPLPEGYLTDWERTRLVNFRHRLADDYVPHDLVNAREFFGSVCDCKLDTTKIQLEVAVYAKLMFEAAAKEGVPHKYFLRNAYRTQSLQWEMWRERVSGSPYYGSDPYSYPVGTMPGNASEHCAGLALDIASLNYPNCDIGFGGTQEGKWLRDNAHRFGFILRYPEDKVHITGVHFEPWHFRYVGVELATEIHSRGICLEEYYGET